MLKPKVPFQNVFQRDIEDKHHREVLQRCRDLKKKYKNLGVGNSFRSQSYLQIRNEGSHDFINIKAGYDPEGIHETEGSPRF